MKYLILGLEHPTSEALFFRTSQQVERLSEIVFTLLMKVFLQCFKPPNCLVCFGIYFTTDTGNDSFDLPFLMWLILLGTHFDS